MKTLGSNFPKPQPIFQLPENFIDDISLPTKPFYPETIRPFVKFGKNQQYGSSTPRQVGSDVFQPSNKYIKTLKPIRKGKRYRKV